MLGMAEASKGGQDAHGPEDPIITIAVVGTITTARDGEAKYVVKIPGVLAHKIIGKRLLKELGEIGFNVVNDADLYTL